MFKVSGRSRSCQAADKTGGGHWKPETKVVITESQLIFTHIMARSILDS